MKNHERKVEVIAPESPSEEEVIGAQDFSRLVTRLDEAKKPLSERHLFRYKQRWFFIAIVILLLLFLILMERF